MKTSVRSTGDTPERIIAPEGSNRPALPGGFFPSMATARGLVPGDLLLHGLIGSTFRFVRFGGGGLLDRAPGSARARSRSIRAFFRSLGSELLDREVLVRLGTVQVPLVAVPAEVERIPLDRGVVEPLRRPEDPFAPRPFGRVQVPRG